MIQIFKKAHILRNESRKIKYEVRDMITFVDFSYTKSKIKTTTY